MIWMAMTVAMATEPVGGSTHVRFEPGLGPAAPATDTRGPAGWSTVAPVLQGKQPGSVELHLDVPPGFVVYRDQVHVRLVQADGVSVGRVDLPPGIPRQVPGIDPVPRQVYEDRVVVKVPVTATRHEGGLSMVRLHVTHQGCFRSVCLPPVEQDVDVRIPVRAEGAPPPPVQSVRPPPPYCSVL